MQAADVIDLYNLLQKNGIQVWIDGGWGIDALLGRQTRPHKDLDILRLHPSGDTKLHLFHRHAFG